MMGWYIGGMFSVLKNPYFFVGQGLRGNFKGPCVLDSVLDLITHFKHTRGNHSENGGL